MFILLHSIDSCNQILSRDLYRKSKKITAFQRILYNSLKLQLFWDIFLMLENKSYNLLLSALTDLFTSLLKYKFVYVSLRYRNAMSFQAHSFSSKETAVFNILPLG